MPLHELDRIGLLASRVQDGETTAAEREELAHLAKNFAEVRALIADLDAGAGAMTRLAADAQVSDGFAGAVMTRVSAEPIHIVPLRRTGRWIAGIAAGTAAAAAVVLWALPGDPATSPTTSGAGTVAKVPKTAAPTLAPKPAPATVPQSEPTPPTTPESAEPPAVAPDAVPSTPAPVPTPAPKAPTRRPAARPAPDGGDPFAPEDELAPDEPGPTVVEAPGVGTPIPTAPGAPAAPAAVVAAALDPDWLAGASVQRQSGAPWQDAARDGSTLVAGDQVTAQGGTVALALQPSGGCALARGASVQVGAGENGTVALALTAGSAFIEAEPRGPRCRLGAALGHVTCVAGGRASVTLDGDGMLVAVVDGAADVQGRDDARPVRVARGGTVRISRGGRAAAPGIARVRLPEFARALMADRMARGYDRLAATRPEWATQRTRVLRQAGELLDAGVAPRALLQLGERAALRAFAATDLGLVYRAYEGGLALGHAPAEVDPALDAIMAREAAGAPLATALDRWLREPVRPRRDADPAPDPGTDRRPPRTQRTAGPSGSGR